MTRYRILPPAKEELRDASRWYEEQREGLGHFLRRPLLLALPDPDHGSR